MTLPIATPDAPPAGLVDDTVGGVVSGVGDGVGDGIGVGVPMIIGVTVGVGVVEGDRWPAGAAPGGDRRVGSRRTRQFLLSGIPHSKTILLVCHGRCP